MMLDWFPSKMTRSKNEKLRSNKDKEETPTNANKGVLFDSDSECDETKAQKEKHKKLKRRSSPAGNGLKANDDSNTSGPSKPKKSRKEKSCDNSKSGKKSDKKKKSKKEKRLKDQEKTEKNDLNDSSPTKHKKSKKKKKKSSSHGKKEHSSDSPKTKKKAKKKRKKKRKYKGFFEDPTIDYSSLEVRDSRLLPDDFVHADYLREASVCEGLGQSLGGVDQPNGEKPEGSSVSQIDKVNREVEPESEFVLDELEGHIREAIPPPEPEPIPPLESEPESSELWKDVKVEPESEPVLDIVVESVCSVSGLYEVEEEPVEVKAQVSHSGDDSDGFAGCGFGDDDFASDNEDVTATLQNSAESAKTAKIKSAGIKIAKIDIVKIEIAKIDTAKIKTSGIKTAKVNTAKTKSAKMKLSKMQAAKILAAKIKAGKIKAAKIRAAKSKSSPTEADTEVEKDVLQDESGTYKCPICDQPFRRKASAESHLRIHRLEAKEGITKSPLASNPLEAEDEIPETYITASPGTALVPKTKDGMFVCTICNKKFQRNTSVYAHKRKFHPEECEQEKQQVKFHENEANMSEEVEKINSARNGLVPSTKDGMFICTICHRKFKCKTSVYAHRSKFHPEESEREKQDKDKDSLGEYKCPYCPKRYNRPTSIYLHKEVAHSKELELERAQKRRKTLSVPGMEDVIVSTISPPRKDTVPRDSTGMYVCTLCNKKFMRNTSVYLHRRTDHPEAPLVRKQTSGADKPNQCPYCPKRYHHKSGLSIHKRAVHGQQHLRDIHTRKQAKVVREGCEKAVTELKVRGPQWGGNRAGKDGVYPARKMAARKHTLPSLLQRDESGKWVCLFCLTTFCRANAWRKHMRAQHPDQLEDTRRNLDKQKKYKCLHCDHTFNYKHSIYDHIKYKHPEIRQQRQMAKLQDHRKTETLSNTQRHSILTNQTFRNSKRIIFELEQSSMNLSCSVGVNMDYLPQYDGQDDRANDHSKGDKSSERTLMTERSIGAQNLDGNIIKQAFLASQIGDDSNMSTELERSDQSLVESKEMNMFPGNLVIVASSAMDENGSANVQTVPIQANKASSKGTVISQVVKIGKESVENAHIKGMTLEKHAVRANHETVVTNQQCLVPKPAHVLYKSNQKVPSNCLQMASNKQNIRIKSEKGMVLSQYEVKKQKSGNSPSCFSQGDNIKTYTNFKLPTKSEKIDIKAESDLLKFSPRKRAAENRSGDVSGLTGKKKKKNEIVGDNTRDFRCLECGTVYSAKTCLARHIKQVHSQKTDDAPRKQEKKQYMCSVPHCDFIRASHDGYVQHMRDAHGVDKAFQCMECELRFQSVSALRTHTEIHSADSNYICSLCGRSFRRQSGLRSHMEYKHSTGDRFACGVCGLSFVEKSKLNRHVVNAHTDGKSFSCSFCGAGLGSKSALEFHERIHRDERPYVCPLCQKACRSDSDLKKHFVVHSKVKPLTCRLCAKSFTRRDYCRKHLSVKHSIIINVGKSPVARNSPGVGKSPGVGNPQSSGNSVISSGIAVESPVLCESQMTQRQVAFPPKQNSDFYQNEDKDWLNKYFNVVADIIPNVETLLEQKKADAIKKNTVKAKESKTRAEKTTNDDHKIVSKPVLEDCISEGIIKCGDLDKTAAVSNTDREAAEWLASLTDTQSIIRTLSNEIPNVEQENLTETWKNNLCVSNTTPVLPVNKMTKRRNSRKQSLSSSSSLQEIVTETTETFTATVCDSNTTPVLPVNKITKRRNSRKQRLSSSSSLEPMDLSVRRELVQTPVYNQYSESKLFESYQSNTSGVSSHRSHFESFHQSNMSTPGTCSKSFQSNTNTPGTCFVSYQSNTSTPSTCYNNHQSNYSTPGTCFENNQSNPSTCLMSSGHFDEHELEEGEVFTDSSDRYVMVQKLPVNIIDKLESVMECTQGVGDSGGVGRVGGGACISGTLEHSLGQPANLVGRTIIDK